MGIENGQYDEPGNYHIGDEDMLDAYSDNDSEENLKAPILVDIEIMLDEMRSDQLSDARDLLRDFMANWKESWPPKEFESFISNNSGEQNG
jgi:hypothetical protein